MPTVKLYPGWVLAACLTSMTATAQPIPVTLDSDISLDCQAIQTEQARLKETIAAGNNDPSIGKAAAAGTANAGAQLAGSIAAQSAGIFGSLGGLLSKAAGSVAQQQVEERLAPDALAVQQAKQAQARADFLSKLSQAKACRADDASFAGSPLSSAEFAALSSGPSAGVVKPLTAAAAADALAQPVTLLAQPLTFEGDLKLGGKRFYLAEFRVLYEVAGEVAARTNAGYMPGTNYGATSSRIKYQVPQVDVAALQALTDKAFTDFQQRLQGAGVTLEPTDAFISQHGAVYPATEAGSTVDSPVYVEENLGHTERKYMVFAPTGMKLQPRGFAGLGAGNIGTRMDWVRNKFEGLNVGVALNFTALETSGSGSSILHRDGASTSAQPVMSIATPSGSVVAQGHVDAGALYMPKPTVVPGDFAKMRETGGFDTQKDAGVKGLQMLGNLMGVAANKSKTVEMALDLDGPTTTRLALQAFSTFNQSLVDKIKAGL
ncbi:MAG: hypothetical protein Q8O85_20960 [Rhodoferax sp.]|uniref:hypothetical protein n=1 Tax=Rhodoferax sp. TaxID=50421 RepID=UPI00273761AF|nr:hypothetical protein [Rhodoferax sp.]MDP2681166.1 hypothetical protein [Rhodoferax sp.]